MWSVAEDVVQTRDDMLGTTEVSSGRNNFQNLPGMSEKDTASLYTTETPIFSKGLMTVEQLSKIYVDPDIQAAVDDFLKVMAAPIFARVVRNGSAEVGQWLGAKIQGERDGWTMRLKMAMEEIEHHRKSALRGQLMLLETYEQLKLLVDCFSAPQKLTSNEDAFEDMLDEMRKSLEFVIECSNTLMEDRFECCALLNSTVMLPEKIASTLKQRIEADNSEKQLHKSQAERFKQETESLQKHNGHLLEEVNKMEDEIKQEKADMEALKMQMKELEEAVKMRKNAVADKCVGTTPDLIPVKETTQEKPASEVKSTHCQTINVTSKDSVCTQTLREPTLIEISEEKLQVLKERAKKLENSIQDAISNMDKLRTVTTTDNRPDSPSSTIQAAAKINPVSLIKQSPQKLFLPGSFEVLNAPGSTSSIAAPKLGPFRGSERRCFSERPPGSVALENDVKTSSEKGKAEVKKVTKPRGGQVSKCLRCQKLFTTTDNHKLACCFHAKGKERTEVYSQGGQLLKVHFIWKCCGQKAECEGCCYGHHV